MRGVDSRLRIVTTNKGGKIGERERLTFICVGQSLEGEHFARLTPAISVAGLNKSNIRYFGKTSFSLHLN